MGSWIEVKTRMPGRQESETGYYWCWSAARPIDPPELLEVYTNYGHVVGFCSEGFGRVTDITHWMSADPPAPPGASASSVEQFLAAEAEKLIQARARGWATDPRFLRGTGAVEITPTNGGWVVELHGEVVWPPLGLDGVTPVATLDEAETKAREIPGARVVRV